MRWPCGWWFRNWYLLGDCARLPVRDRSQGDSWSRCFAPAVGYHLVRAKLDLATSLRDFDTDSNRGILIQYFIQYGASFVDGGPKAPNQGASAFRIPWGIQAVPGLILFVGLFFFPKSPRWLASKDRWEEAIQVLANLHGGGDTNHPKVLAEYKEIEDALRFEREEAETSFAALVKPRILKRVILGMSIQMWSQLCGTSHSRTKCT